jgi:hypothetical protein
VNRRWAGRGRTTCESCVDNGETNWKSTVLAVVAMIA